MSDRKKREHAFAASQARERVTDKLWQLYRQGKITAQERDAMISDVCQVQARAHDAGEEAGR